MPGLSEEFCRNNKHSHVSFTLRQRTEDTLACKPIDKTAAELGIEHHTVFNMRHKILKALEDSDEECPIELGEVTELDETFVLESYKGSKADLKNAGRKSRKANMCVYVQELNERARHMRIQ